MPKVEKSKESIRDRSSVSKEEEVGLGKLKLKKKTLLLFFF
jgi:hypothetical protein